MAAVDGMGSAAALKNGFGFKNGGFYIGRLKKPDGQKGDLFN